MKNNFLKTFCSAAAMLITCTSFAQTIYPDEGNYPYKKEPQTDKEALSYEPLRQADVFWEKRVWRVIDFREKMNLPFTWPKDPFVQYVYDLVVSGEITAYSPLYDDFSGAHVIPAKDVFIHYNHTDTITIVDPDTYRETKKPITNPFNYQDVKKLKLMEDWIFDEQTSTMVVRIIGVALVRERIDPDTGEPLGEEDMFWLYYPELRRYITQFSTFNTHNGAGYFTFEDIFENRFFSSYIIKEDNVYDRYVNSYAAGVDEVLESDRIKNELFEFEHTVWEY